MIGSSVFFSMLAGTSLISMARSMPEYQMQAQKWILLAAASIWLMCLVTYFIVQRMIRDNQEKMEYQLILQEEKFRRESLEQLKNSNEELREFKHDLKNCLLPIQQKIQNQNMEGAGAIWEEICRKIDGIQILVQTGNEYIDVVLNEKMSIARREQIDVKCFIVSRIEKIDVLAFCSILGNLMDNAIEAERKIKEGNKRIEVEMNIKYGFLHLKVKNRIEDSILEENPELATTKGKKEEHGIGHKSIERTVKKLSGKVKYYEKNDLFCAEVVFPVEAAKDRGNPSEVALKYHRRIPGYGLSTDHRSPGGCRIWTGSEHPRGAGKDRRQMHHRKLFRSCRRRKYQHDQRNMRPVPARNG